MALGVSADRDWLKGYYQYANRIAALHFLTQHKVPAHLLLIYFLGDRFSVAYAPQTRLDGATRSTPRRRT